MNSLVIGIAGKMGVGKSTVAEGLAAALRRRKQEVAILSFGDEVKREAALVYGFDEVLTHSIDGKNEIVLVDGKERTIRWCLQTHGQARREEDPNYWVKSAMKTAKEAAAKGATIIIFDDVRHLPEVAAIRAVPHNMVFRLCPYEGYKVDAAIAAHVSETELDKYSLKDFTRVFVPMYGKLASVISECMGIVLKYIEQNKVGLATVADPDEFVSVAEAIGYFQQRDKLTRNMMAKRLGLSQREYLLIEKGRELPTTEQAATLAELFDVPASYFFTGSAEGEDDE